MKGPCAKRRVSCHIQALDGTWYVGENACEDAQDVCPRLAGEGYEKCQSICKQGGHAEIEALKKAGTAARGARAFIYGHYYMCEPCGRALAVAGVEVITMVPTL